MPVNYDDAVRVDKRSNPIPKRPPGWRPAAFAHLPPLDPALVEKFVRKEDPDHKISVEYEVEQKRIKAEEDRRKRMASFDRYVDRIGDYVPPMSKHGGQASQVKGVKFGSPGRRSGRG